MIDQLGDYFKSKEKEFDLTLDSSKITIIRLDGIRFHNFTKPFLYPFDPYLRFALEKSLLDIVCTELKGYVSHVYFQSDEASIIIPPIELPNQIPFSGRINKLSAILLQWNLAFFQELQKILNIGFTETDLSSYHETPLFQYIKQIEIKSKQKSEEWFNQYIELDYWYQLDTFLNEQQHYPAFDCRIFQVDDLRSVSDYFSWRRIDAIRNFKNSLGYCFYSTKELQHLSAEKIREKVEKDFGIKYHELPAIIKRGSIYRFLKYQSWINDRFEPNDPISNDFQMNIIKRIHNWNELFIIEKNGVDLK